MRFRSVSAGLFLLAIVLLPLAKPARAEDRVVVVYPDSSKNTLRTISGLSWGLSQGLSEGKVIEYYLGSDPGNDYQRIKQIDASLLVTIGTRATAFADRFFPTTPVVFAKVLNPLESGFIDSWSAPGRHLTGASLDIPVLLQLEKFAAIIPQLKKVGVIYTTNTRRLVEEARAAASQLGLTLVTYEVTSVKELPAAVDSLCRSADGIWTVADEQLTTPQFVRYTLLETLRNGKPIMGFSQSFVESGALFCLEPDYKYIGRQAASIALAVLNGADPARLAPSIPDVVYLYLNLKTEHLLNLKVPKDMIDIAKETY
jgi:putative ABC transport system substrate-binding protein